jgi:hypothetical protein
MKTSGDFVTATMGGTAAARLPSLGSSRPAMSVAPRTLIFANVDLVDAFAADDVGAGWVVHADAALIPLEHEEFVLVDGGDGREPDVPALARIGRGDDPSVTPQSRTFGAGSSLAAVIL